nr:hypothetical transcript [Hymenolepis microstoma]
MLLLSLHITFVLLLSSKLPSPPPSPPINSAEVLTQLYDHRPIPMIFCASVRVIVIYPSSVPSNYDVEISFAFALPAAVRKQTNVTPHLFWVSTPESIKLSESSLEQDHSYSDEDLCRGFGERSRKLSSKSLLLVDELGLKLAEQATRLCSNLMQDVLPPSFIENAEDTRSVPSLSNGLSPTHGIPHSLRSQIWPRLTRAYEEQQQERTGCTEGFSLGLKKSPLTNSEITHYSSSVSLKICHQIEKIKNVSLGMRSGFSYKVKAFSSTDERIVLFPVTRSTASMGVDFNPPVISRNVWLCVFSSGLRIASEAVTSASQQYSCIIG